MKRWKNRSYKSNVKANHFYWLTTGRLSYTFEMLDNNGALMALDWRYPFIDKELVEYCYSLPSEQKVKNSWEKYILRKSMTNILPKKIQWRRKNAGSAINILDRFAEYGRTRIKENIMREMRLIEEYVDYKKLLRAYSRYEKFNTIKELNTVWAVLILARWLNRIRKGVNQ